MATRTFDVISICSGVGTFDLGIKIAIPSARTICYVERELFSAACLVAQMQDGSLDQAPIWDDLASFDGKPWNGLVDCIAAGLPCQPYSIAGDHKGHSDDRAIWPSFVRVVDQCRPGIIYLENVARFAMYFQPIGKHLSQMGYRVSRPLFITAKSVGAEHERARSFYMAYSDNKGLAREWLRTCGISEIISMHASNDVSGMWGCRNEPKDEIRIKPELGRVANGMANRIDRIRAIGNGVVPIQAAFAFRFLASKIDDDKWYV